jgi:hypothetical protein
MAQLLATQPPGRRTALPVIRSCAVTASICSILDRRSQASVFRPEASKATPGGVLVNHFVRAGKVRTGSIEQS